MRSSSACGNGAEPAPGLRGTLVRRWVASRTMATHVETLAKLRSGGKQQVIVKHVYINGNAVVGDGTQAVFGDVGGRGDGGPDHPQSHAQPAANALIPALLSEDASGLAVPVAGGQRAATLPDARWNEPGWASGPRERQVHSRLADEGDEGASPVGARAERLSPPD